MKKLPLRNPGQSLEEQIDEFLNERMMAWLIIVAYAVAFVVLEWIRWLLKDQFRPLPYTLAGVTAVVFSVWQIRRSRHHLQDLKTGLLGERQVGQFLQNGLLRKGYWVVHDICEDGFNIDHAVIGPGGVFAVETKTRRKPKGDVRIDYDGTRVLVNGFAPDRDPVVQARAAADRLQRILLEGTGTKVYVRSVVLFPGWYVNDQPKGCETWVLNEKSFVKFLDHEPEQLSHEDIFRLAAALGRYVRDREEKKK